MDQNRFMAELDNWSTQISLYVGVAKNSEFQGRTEVPVSVLASRFNHDNRCETHTTWFPWATPRNMIEVSLAYLTKMVRNGTNVTIYSRRPDEGFFRHMTRYGVLRHVGIEFQHFEDGEAANVWQAV